MKLHLEYPKNFLTNKLMLQEKIPCTIQISNEFNILFYYPLVGFIGKVYDWNKELLEERAIPMVGDYYTHNEQGAITLKKESDNIFLINELNIFYPDFGWCKVIENGEYAIPTNFYGNDEDDPVYMERIAKEKKLKDKS
jgi:hypothetical protein